MSIIPLNFARHANQIHGVNEADCEIVRINNNSYLATTVDSVAEEISLGLYRDPYTMGWVCATASLSDLAAAGVSPLGLLFSTQWGEGVSEEFKKSVFHGFNDALQSASTFLLGGDTGSSRSTVLSSVGIGMSSEQPRTRVGVRVGDYVCVTGKTGRGPALAFRYLKNEPPMAFEEIHFRPRARIEEGKHLQGIATAMIDSSDGLLSALSELQSVNRIGFALEWNPSTLDPLAMAYCEQRKLPLWLLWVGEHGDFELIVTIPPEKLYLAQSLCPCLHVIGRIVEAEAGVTLAASTRKQIDLKSFQSIHSGQSVDPSNIAMQFDKLLAYLKREEFP